MRLWNNVKTTMLLASLIALCAAIGYLVAGPTGLILGFLFGGLMNIIGFFYSDKIAIRMMQGQEVTRQQAPELVDMVARLSERAGIPMPRVYICPQDAPNAFATGRSPKHAAVAITQGMLRGFPMAEIEGVMAHEIAHVKHRDVLISTLAAIMAGTISAIAQMMMWSMLLGGRDARNQSPLGLVAVLAAIVLAPIAAALIQLAISRQREYAADSYGGELCGDPNKLANALQRLTVANERIPTQVNPAFNQMFIVEPLTPTQGNALSGKLSGLFATHPDTKERIRRLRELARYT